MSINYQINSGFDILSLVVREFQAIDWEGKSYGESLGRQLHKLRRHAEIFGGFTEAYLTEEMIRKHNYERWLSHEQSAGRIKYSASS